MDVGLEATDFTEITPEQFAATKSASKDELVEVPRGIFRHPTRLVQPGPTRRADRIAGFVTVIA